MTKKMVIILLLMLVIATAITASLMVRLQNNDSLLKMDAIEGKTKADELANIWHDDAIFLGIGLNGEIDSDGKATSWIYSYFSPSTESLSNNLSMYEVLNAYISSDNDYDTVIKHSVLHTEPVLNVSINSCDTMSIAKNTQEINAFLSRYSDAKVDHFYLRVDDNYSQNAIWDIRWLSPGGLDDPHNAYIVIDASTGEVLEVEVQMDS
ncbi:MAG: hypothetical protein Q7J68_06015 [Thermoplasmata archaeon]|nr:hypothetical protein [Thermoplasmata archaeon]